MFHCFHANRTKGKKRRRFRPKKRGLIISTGENFPKKKKESILTKIIKTYPTIYGILLYIRKVKLKNKSDLDFFHLEVKKKEKKRITKFMVKIAISTAGKEIKNITFSNPIRIVFINKYKIAILATLFFFVSFYKFFFFSTKT